MTEGDLPLPENGHLNISKKLLTKVPDRLPTGTRSLDISNNNISGDIAGVARLFAFNIQKLTATRCNITNSDFEPRKCPLYELNLSFNRLESGTAALIAQIPYVYSIMLHFCGLDSVPPFPDDSKVRNLILSENALFNTAHLAQIFVLPFLEKLVLCGSQIKRIPQFDVTHSRLYELDMSGCDLSGDPVGVTRLFKMQLSKLVLRSCKLKTILVEPAKSKLTELNLGSNPQLDMLSIQIVTQIISLNVLNATNCGLSKVFTFPSSSKLNTIIISGNILTDTTGLSSILENTSNLEICSCGIRQLPSFNPTVSVLSSLKIYNDTDHYSLTDVINMLDYRSLFAIAYLSLTTLNEFTASNIHQFVAWAARTALIQHFDLRRPLDRRQQQLVKRKLQIEALQRSFIQCVRGTMSAIESPWKEDKQRTKTAVKYVVLYYKIVRYETKIERVMESSYTTLTAAVEEAYYVEEPVLNQNTKRGGCVLLACMK